MQNNITAVYQDSPQAIIVTEKHFADGDCFPVHSHDRGQFAYAASGVISVETPDGNWAVPPQCAIWVPGGLVHAMQMRGPVIMLNGYISDAAAHRLRLPQTSQVFGVSILLRELLAQAVALAEVSQPEGRGRSLLDFLLYEIASMPALSLNAPLPDEPRLQAACRAFLLAPSLETSVDDMAARVGMSRRTFTRQFRQQTGISFVAWRQQACLLTAIGRLGEGEAITRIALDLGYSSPGAFSGVFKKALGKTPGRYFAEKRTD
ncbi:helix-turn-helix transcriptional regulator [Enterobacter sp. Ap-916]|uniref:AraC family transcriptional regulator n=1 Tax=unclassified Enterobacter TaxID=2608935 RepID=UPI0014221CEE|nr:MULTISPECIES: helix-turn-helix transcriptional regulator [unclassified Enterobacter]NIF60704.1 helix-turn-helix transcriptional regulator [Enterobacter sp. Ap-867]NIG31858.1 helix-turn-helix transcriptional regulator [Enterobacter sp. Ap-916]